MAAHTKLLPLRPTGRNGSPVLAKRGLRAVRRRYSAGGSCFGDLRIFLLAAPGKYLSNINGVTDAFVGGWLTNFIFSHQTGQPFTILCPVATTAGFGCLPMLSPGSERLRRPTQRYPVAQPGGIRESARGNPGRSVRLFAARRWLLTGAGSRVSGPRHVALQAVPYPRSDEIRISGGGFNLRNWHSFANPAANLNFLNSQGFSAITSSRSNPRILQLALKLYY